MSNDAIPYLAMTADIVTAYLGRAKVQLEELASLISSVHDALSSAAVPKAERPAAGTLKPAVPIKRSVTPDYLICLEDGRKLKSLKRHLRTAFDLSPEAYRAKWGLPVDYPMAAPNYAAARSRIAKERGLGRAAGHAEGPSDKGGPPPSEADIVEPNVDLAYNPA